MVCLRAGCEFICLCVYLGLICWILFYCCLAMFAWFGLFGLYFAVALFPCGCLGFACFVVLFDAGCVYVLCFA